MHHYLYFADFSSDDLQEQKTNEPEEVTKFIEDENEEEKDKSDEMEGDAKETLSGDNNEEVCNMMRFAFHFLFNVLSRMLVISNEVFFFSVVKCILKW